MNDLPNVKGLADLTKAFENIASDARKRVLRKMGSAGGRYMGSAVRAATPIGKRAYKRKGAVHQPGTLQKAEFYFYDRKDSNAGQSVFVVKYRQKTGFYAPWVFGGHRIVPRKGKSGQTLRVRRASSTTGQVPPNTAFEQAVTGAAERTIEVMVEAGQAEMAKIIAERI